MHGKWITVATLVLAAACAPVTDDDVAAISEDVPYSSDDEEQGSVEVKQQAVTFDANCTQLQRDALANANFLAYLLAESALTNWTSADHHSRRSRWFGSYGASFLIRDLRERTRAIRNLAASGGPMRFFCAPDPVGTALALTFSSGQITIFPEFWERPLGGGDNVEPSGGFFPGSQTGILLHEYAHYVGAKGLPEIIGPSACSALSSNSTKAFNNADSWRMYLTGI